MKQLYTLIIVVFLGLGNNNLKAQEWFLVGAEYTYTKYEPTFSSFGSIKEPFPMSVIGLDTINGYPFSKIYYSGSFSLTVYEYIGYRNDSVYFLDTNTDSISLLFDLSKIVGDSFDIRFSNYDIYNDSILNMDTFRVYIDSIEPTFLNNVSVNKYNISIGYLTNNDYCVSFYNDEFIEYIGYTDWMFNDYCQLTELSLGNLRCYENDSIGLVKFVDYPCDTVISPSVGIKGVKQNNVNFSVYPNPSSQFITIEISEALNEDQIQV